MPIYEYECTACKTRFERSQRFSDPPVTECPECGGQVRRVLFPVGIVFKGSGWYITDSRASTSATTTSPTPNGAAAGEGAADKGAADKGGADKGAAKPEGASAPKSAPKSESSSSSAGNTSKGS